MIRRIVVPVEVYRGHITEATREALVAARTVGNGVGEVVAYVYGEPPAEATDVLELADRIIVLEDGQVGTPVAMAQAKLLREELPHPTWTWFWWEAVVGDGTLRPSWRAFFRHLWWPIVR